MLILGLITKTFKFLNFLRGLLANKFFCVYLQPQVEAPYPHTPKKWARWALHPCTLTHHGPDWI